MTAVAVTERPLFEAVGVTKHFGGLPAASDVSLALNPGDILGLIGPNGAGKSTVLNCLSGIDRPTAGKVFFSGWDVTNWSVHKRVRHGIGRTFQLLRLFPTLSVTQNLSVALDSTLMTRVAGGPDWKRGGLSKAEVRRRCETSLERVGLAPLAQRPIGSLTAGQKRLVEVARLVAMDLDLLLLDEPAAGLNHGEGEELFSIIEGLAAEGKAILLVEHRIRSVVRVVHHLVVMDHGAVIAEGAPGDVMSLPVVQEAYMGVDHDARS